jgi:transposase
MQENRRVYPTDITDDEWAFCAPYLCLMKEDAPQRQYPLREVLNALRYMVRAGCSWRLLPTNFPPWEIVYQQTVRWIQRGCFEAMCHDLRELLRLALGKNRQPSAVIMDSRTLQSTLESGQRAGYDGCKKRKGSKVHIAVDTLGCLLALKVTPASEQDRTQVGDLTREVQEVTGHNVQLAYVDQGYTGETPAAAAAENSIELHVVKLSVAKRGFVLLPRRWVVERSFGWASRFRRLARDYERIPRTLANFHWLAFACLFLRNLF